MESFSGFLPRWSALVPIAAGWAQVTWLTGVDSVGFRMPEELEGAWTGVRKTPGRWEVHGAQKGEWAMAWALRRPGRHGTAGKEGRKVLDWGEDPESPGEESGGVRSKGWPPRRLGGGFQAQ